MSFLTAFLGCDSPTGNQKTCTPYFQFDKIEHYYLDIEENNIWDIEKKKNKTNKEKKQLELLIEYIPEKLSDTLVLKDIDKLDFVKKGIPTNKFKQINEIFCQRNHDETIALACIAVYRDILIFKKNNKIVGTAKICFDCDQNIITGTKVNTDEFGQSGDYSKLYKLLH